MLCRHGLTFNVGLFALDQNWTLAAYIYSSVVFLRGVLYLDFILLISLEYSMTTSADLFELVVVVHVSLFSTIIYENETFKNTKKGSLTGDI